MSPRNPPHALIGAVSEAWEAGLRAGRARRSPRKDEREAWRRKGLLGWFMRGHRQGRIQAEGLEKKDQLDLL